LHYQSGRFLAEEGIDMLITYGELSRNTAKGALDHGMGKDKVSSFKDKHDIRAFLARGLKKGDIVLVKGSRSMGMEEVCNCFINCFTR
jgi:UDP-N-acetylmuramoyl-tripeptide--D-alanyl-D-alanine ligase